MSKCPIALENYSLWLCSLPFYRWHWWTWLQFVFPWSDTFISLQKRIGLDQLGEIVKCHKKVGKFHHRMIYKKNVFFLNIAMFSLDTSWAMEKKLLRLELRKLTLWLSKKINFHYQFTATIFTEDIDNYYWHTFTGQEPKNRA